MHERALRLLARSRAGRTRSTASRASAIGCGADRRRSWPGSSAPRVLFPSAWPVGRRRSEPRCSSSCSASSRPSCSSRSSTASARSRTRSSRDAVIRLADRRRRAGARGARRRREPAHDEAERVRLRARRDAARRALRHARRDGDEPEVLTVVAHELGHRRYRHVALGTALAMVGSGRVRRRPLGAAPGRRRPERDRRDRRRRRARRALRPPRRLAARAPARTAAGGALAQLGVRVRPLRRRADGRPGRLRVGVRPPLRGEPARPGAAAARLPLALLAPDRPERLEAARRAAASITVPA